ncbi:protein of unknown function (plasmid) [Cupriavidus taiwanensis]|uniref:Uncharacterized protein n=1 Tax=Cupriavidus taiwanensis TaxID=164546 RepID=A0A375HCR8_9BURK|nr:protein of unknown function [Cupriavidus taiwanensis]SPA57282.1 protein of unknown function [Cupriavidus taiwanensis]SPD49105.1 protein of unknown function [Cupriavidus taiwanensis]
MREKFLTSMFKEIFLRGPGLSIWREASVHRYRHSKSGLAFRQNNRKCDAQIDPDSPHSCRTLGGVRISATNHDFGYRKHALFLSKGS